MRFLFVPTWRYRSNCPPSNYTVERQDYGGYVVRSEYGEHYIPYETSARNWLKMLAPHTPYHLHVTGGEPMLWSDIGILARELPEGCSWSIRTTLPRPDLDWSRCTAVVDRGPSVGTSEPTTTTLSPDGLVYQCFADMIQRVGGQTLCNWSP